ncbi:hypothetical protein RND64_13190 [Gordonia sp. w5E2]|uniref:hypothetical protein n=1 Tax=Gordonia TaxID=2053 RepID=UPI0006723C1E|nr:MULTISPECIES: hypothetical protein [Gordonia]
MLSLALAATLVGFVLLIVGLITGTVWLAVACIVVCLIGLGFLIVDIIGSGRKDDRDPGDDQVDEEPDTRGRRSDAVAESDRSESDVFDAGAARRDSPPQSSWQGVIQPGGRSGPRSDVTSNPESGPDASGAVAPDADARSADSPSAGSSSADTRGTDAPPSEAKSVPSSREGNYDDYLRAVGGDPATGGFRRPPAAGEQAPPQSGEQAGPPQFRSEQRPPAQGYRQQPPQGPSAQGYPPQPYSQRPYPQGPYPQRPYPQGDEPQRQPGADQRSGTAPRQSDREQPRGIQQPPSDDGKPSDRPWEQPEREQGSGTARFDPLDPNWRPPLD